MRIFLKMSALNNSLWTEGGFTPVVNETTGIGGSYGQPEGHRSPGQEVVPPAQILTSPASCTPTRASCLPHLFPSKPPLKKGSTVEKEGRKKSQWSVQVGGRWLWSLEDSDSVP